MNIGIIGAGAMARAIAFHAIRVGHDVMLSNTRGVSSLSGISKSLNCQVGTPSDAAKFGDIVIAAVPLYAISNLPEDELKGKIVVDPLNYFPHRDGDIFELKKGLITTSELLARALPDAIVVKGFNSITVDDLVKDSRTLNALDRRAIPIASDDPEAKQKVAEFVQQLGFDVVDAGILKDSWRFERFRPVYCVALKKDILKQRLLATTRDTWVPDGYWLFNRMV
ncbi:TPA: NAD(P)-binding domain-containing protein [Providencia stuartii]|uniref:NADPH-dependent F420 reductase n=1 Tax=Providencia stuartii TaxID=588 RepID=UPI00123876BC|nr:NAD(P)-binding domain-containing protein [Providencia stuartii]QET97367.1 NADP oxidoreductase [Providencia stuartii]UQZ12944.1 NAD(P)-binding domain-containing protein [Providencia stuartii]HEM8145630.1 NAD(P)-binding domain-containing protein [Providencia stuartii]HEM8876202.1 NAD(P)-binding domain-containing protein [Providencia stuartii]